MCEALWMKAYEQERLSARKCVKCGRRRGKSKRLCIECLRLDRERKRRERGSRPWDAETRIGRRPLYQERKSA